MDEIQRELLKRYPDAYVKLKQYNIMYKRVSHRGPVHRDPTLPYSMR